MAVRVYGDPIMRATVGPLPSAVYWRRRAVVLGAVLLGIIVLFVSCSGGDKNDQRGGKGSPSSQLPTPAPAKTTPGSPGPSFAEGVPGGNGPSLPALGDLESDGPGDDGSGTGTGTGSGTATTPPPGNGTGQNTNVTAPADGSCADTELAVAAGTPTVSVKRGATVQMSLTVKNISTRACGRDVGAGPQELYLDQAARKYWSSDTCSTDKGSDVKQFAPGEVRVYKVSWNGRQSTSCAGSAASGDAPAPGQYELRARLGTLYSQPVTMTITS